MVCVSWLWVFSAFAAPTPMPLDLLGSWIVRADWGDASIGAPLALTQSGAAIEGSSGPLDIPGFHPLQLHGTRTGARAHLIATADGKVVGNLELSATLGVLHGAGRLFGTPVTILGIRAAKVQRAPTTFDYAPTQFHVLTSGVPEPVLRLVPGDTVRTRTVDAYGVDENGAQAAMAGNAATGPFYVDGAMPGDTLAVHIVKLTPNRATARMARKLAPTAVEPAYAQTLAAGRTDVWRLDRARGTARLEAPSDRLRDFEVALRPMLGVVAVAPPAGLSEPNGDLGEWGGNLDFPEIREGVTLYLPVYQPGALLFLGDAHARQGDGEVTGQGLETSMAVEFQVSVLKGEALKRIWAENSDYVMVCGIGGSMNEALEQATTGLAAWLNSHDRLDDNDIAAVLGSSVEYQIAEVVDGKYHVVAKLRKQTLALIRPLP
jgi:acetamidase/formamidase